MVSLPPSTYVAGVPLAIPVWWSVPRPSSRYGVRRLRPFRYGVRVPQAARGWEEPPRTPARSELSDPARDGTQGQKASTARKPIGTIAGL